MGIDVSLGLKLKLASRFGEQEVANVSPAQRLTFTFYLISERAIDAIGLAQTLILLTGAAILPLRR